MKAFLEVWLRGFAKDHLREISIGATAEYHPHVTIVRPFEIRGDPDGLKNKISELCRVIPPLPFSLEGQASFDEGKILYVPVINAGGLLTFSDYLEQAIERDVVLVPKIGDSKHLHATVHVDGKEFNCPRVDQYMLRLTAISQKRIWFSYDFITKKTLTREESLDEQLWHTTVHEFSERYRLLPTKNGFKPIN